MITWPVAFAIVGTAFAICTAVVRIFPCKLQPICSSAFSKLDKRIDDEVGAAWREVDLGKNDRKGIREEIRAMERNEVELKTEMIGIHREIKEIKESIGSMSNKLDSLNQAIAKRNSDR